MINVITTIFTSRIFLFYTKTCGSCRETIFFLIWTYNICMVGYF